MSVAVIAAEDLPPGDRLFVEIKGSEIAVLNVDSEYYAVENFCPHLEGPVGQGEVTCISDEDENPTKTLRCPWHGWEFSLDSGDPLFAGRERLNTYDVTVEDGTVVVDI